MFKSRKAKSIFYFILWLLCFSLVNWPVGMIGQRLDPFIFGMPFSLFYFWAAYTLLIAVGLLIAWRLFRD